MVGTVVEVEPEDEGFVTPSQRRCIRDPEATKQDRREWLSMSYDKEEDTGSVRVLLGEKLCFRKSSLFPVLNKWSSLPGVVWVRRRAEV